MNTDQVKGNFKEIQGKLKEKWGKLTDDDFKLFEGKRDQFAGRVQAEYGIAKEQAQRDVEEFAKSCGCSTSKAA